MKSQLSRLLSVFYTVAAVFLSTFALSVVVAGCDSKDTGDDGDAGADTGAAGPNGGNNVSQTSGSNGNLDPFGSSEEGITTEETPDGGESNVASTDEDAEVAEDSEDTDENGDEPDGATDGDEPDGGTDGDEPNGSRGGSGANDRTQCTPGDLSECSDINITGGLLPMDVCCTENGFCGGAFTLPDGSTTGCVTDQFVNPPIIPECEACASSSCQGEFSACENDLTCATLNDCLTNCIDLMTCAECVVDNAAGLMNYGTLAVCAVGACPICVEQFGRLLPAEIVDAIQNANIGGGGMPGGGMPGGFTPGGGMPGGGF